MRNTWRRYYWPDMRARSKRRHLLQLYPNAEFRYGVETKQDRDGNTFYRGYGIDLEGRRVWTGQRHEDFRDMREDCLYWARSAARFSIRRGGRADRRSA